MKKLMLVVVLLISSLSMMYAQDTIVLNVEDVTPMDVCCGTVLAIYATEQNCNDWFWELDNLSHGMENPLIIQSQVEHVFRVEYNGCDISLDCYIGFVESSTPMSFTHTVWKRFGELMTIEPVGTDSLLWYDYLWSTGATTSTIDVINPGIYTCQIYDFCGTATRTFIVRDNVEIDLATCDLETNLNMVTWQTTTAQAEYVDHVIIKRDGLEVGTASYSDGFFLDNIGSDLAQRTYTVIAVGTDGSQCPIVSYPKETIHMAYLTGVNNTIEVNWNIPTGYDLLGYNICEWIPNGKDGELNVIDFVGASVTSYTCTESQFNNGHVVVQGVENGRTESRLLSNRSEESILGIGELETTNFKVYPNPSNGTFTIDGVQTLTIYNVMGQIIATSHADNGVHTISLGSAGVYFVRSDEGIVKKVVVQ